MKFIVGLTGGIGSGKSTVAKLFTLFGFDVFNSDVEAKLLYKEMAVIEKVRKIFGDDILYEGEIDLKKLGKIAFSEKEKLEELNNLIHPLVKQKFEQFVSTSISGLILKESALMFETGIYKDNHFNILVCAPLELRINRVIARDGFSEEEIKRRINLQLSDEEKTKLSDAVIYNDDNHSLISQTLDSIKKIKEKGIRI